MDPSTFALPAHAKVIGPELSKIILAPLPGCDCPVDSKPRVSHKTLHPGLSSLQPFGLATPEACKDISSGYAFFAYPGRRFTVRIAPRRRCEEWLGCWACISERSAFLFW